MVTKRQAGPPLAHLVSSPGRWGSPSPPGREEDFHPHPQMTEHVIAQKKAVVTYLRFWFKKWTEGSSLVIQWVGLHAFTAKGTTSISSWELRSHKPCGVDKKKKIADSSGQPGLGEK